MEREEHCPRCGSGRSARGERCVVCGEAAGAPEGSAHPASWQQPAFERAPAADGAPGHRGRSRLSRLRGALESAGETALSMALRPEQAFRTFRLDGGFRSPLAYALLLAGPSLVLNALWKVSFPGTGFTGSFRISLPLLAVLLGSIPVYVYLRAQTLHLTLVLTGCVSRSFESTFRLVSYSNASAAPLLVIPFAGDLVFLAAGALIEVTALRAVHDLTLRQAVVSEVLPIAALFMGFGAMLLVRIVSWSQEG